jgi:hypothetical protein
MSASWAIIVGVMAALAVTCFGDLVSEEIRGRLDLLTRALIRLAVRRVPEDVRDDLHDDWLAELEVFLHGREALPITRLIHGVGFALGLVRTARGIGRDLGAKEPTDGLTPVEDTFWNRATPEDWAVLGVDVSRPSAARVYDYLLGGMNNFAADRVVGDQIRQVVPEVRIGVEAQRAVLGRVVRYLTAEAGIRQFIDIGSGLPTAGNVHEIAQAVVPEARVAYVDNDSIVFTHMQSLLSGDDRTVAIDGDLRRPEKILADPALVGCLNLTQPVGLLLCGIMHLLTDEENPAGLVTQLWDALPSGSYVFIHHLIQADDPKAAAAEAALRRGIGSGRLRPVEEVERLFDGLELVDPGVVPVPEWRPELGEPSSEDHPILALAVAGVGRKP